MKFNLVLMVIGLILGYVEQSKSIFVIALILGVYRYVEAHYFIEQYKFFAKTAFNKSKWTTFTTILMFIWMFYLAYITMNVLFK